MKKRYNFKCNPRFVINIFISNCNLIVLFSVSVTQYSYFYFVIKLRNVTCIYSPTLFVNLHKRKTPASVNLTCTEDYTAFNHHVSLQLLIC